MQHAYFQGRTMIKILGQWSNWGWVGAGGHGPPLHYAPPPHIGPPFVFSLCTINVMVKKSLRCCPLAPSPGEGMPPPIKTQLRHCPRGCTTFYKQRRVAVFNLVYSL